MNAGLVNQLMSCYWLDMGLEIESPKQKEIQTQTILQRVQKLKRRKIKFDF